MEQSWEFQFRQEALEKGHSEEFIGQCLDYAQILRQKNLPPIFSADHLCAILDISDKDREKFGIGSGYFDYEIRKKNGGTRKISAPMCRLKKCQKWILKRILEPCVCNINREVADHITGFMKGRSILDNAKWHTGKRWVLNVDISDFFSSITADKVRDLFLSLGYVDEVAGLLCDICTKWMPYHRRYLPQGSPASPLIANLISVALDSDLLALAAEKGASYSRYADDITFSGYDSICPINIDAIYEIIKGHGLKPNYKKTRLRYRSAKMEVTGLTVNDGIHVPKKYRREILSELHFIKKYGLNSHKERRGYDKGFYKEWLLGRIMFVRSIDRQQGDKMLKSFSEINWYL